MSNVQVSMFHRSEDKFTVAGKVIHNDDPENSPAQYIEVEPYKLLTLVIAPIQKDMEGSFKAAIIPTEKNGSGGLSKGAIIGIVVGSLILATIVITAIICIVRRRK
eukprot:CAMPEP_0197008136 /NCGR_PEP_ID=MMETSP1380-20130617/43995_1 /TAXON_ID=5936 /ORGANISM="Euplotes crassus, Strain CT5" /LENGTH=105 /DNA_ID=CAMNT_0042428593 /DNA_START=432 /DNA_END=746 /DNA_ORIENTATION=+